MATAAQKHLRTNSCFQEAQGKSAQFQILSFTFQADKEGCFEVRFQDIVKIHEGSFSKIYQLIAKASSMKQEGLLLKYQRSMIYFSTSQPMVVQDLVEYIEEKKDKEDKELIKQIISTLINFLKGQNMFKVEAYPDSRYIFTPLSYDEQE